MSQREIILLLPSIRSTYNVGAILRSADGFGVTEVICSGTTPCEKNPAYLPHQSEKVARAIAKTALGAEKSVKISWTEDMKRTVSRLKADGFQIVALENNLDQETVLLSDKNLNQRLNSKIALILGEEVDGIAKTLLTEVDLCLEIPMVGKKESFNVSVAAGIALFALFSA